MRPPLDDNITIRDLQDFYWMRSELAAWCSRQGLSTSGAKLELLGRMIRFLETGDKGSRQPKVAGARRTRFDWHNAPLTKDTRITTDYSTTRNVRDFFIAEIGPQFRITVPFTAWLRQHPGKTLGDAMEAWTTIVTAKKKDTGSKEIAPQFEFNRYIRAFMADNPGRSRKEAVACWMQKKQRRGPRVYHPDDLLLIADHP